MCSARRQPVGVPTRDMGTGEGQARRLRESSGSAIRPRGLCQGWIPTGTLLDLISTGPDALPNGFVPEFIRHNVRAKAEWSDWRRKGERLDAACIR